MSNDSNPEGIGYSIYWDWQDQKDFIVQEDFVVTIFSVLIIVATKLFLLGFCYEILQQIHKHRIHHKTHEWYYYYWGAQILIICTLAAVIYFEVTKQRNKIALYLFLSSFGVDLFLVTLVGILGCLWYTCADCCGCNTCCFGCCKWCKKLIKKLPKRRQYQRVDQEELRDVRTQDLVHNFEDVYTQTDVDIQTDTQAQIGTLTQSPQHILVEAEVHTETSGMKETLAQSEPQVSLKDKAKKQDALIRPAGTQIQTEVIDAPIQPVPQVTRDALTQTGQVDAQTQTGEKDDVGTQTRVVIETSIVDECVPPPLMSLFQCCPFCCCSNESPYYSKVRIFWLCCLPICCCFCCGDKEKCMCSSTGCCFCKWCDCQCCCACCICPFCTYLPSGNRKEDQDDPLYNNKSCKFCVDKRNKCDNFTWKRCGNCWRVCWTLATNIISLIIFLAFVSYLSQALPAIVISYYLSPTASLIRLGFFEVIIVVLLFEAAYLLFLVDKLTWLCYLKKHKRVPEEIKFNVHNSPDSVDIKQKTFISQYIAETDGDHDASNLIYNNLCRCENCLYPACCCCCSCEMKCKLVKCCKQMDDCHWLFSLTVLQIFTMVFIIALSAALLFFLLNVVIQQTSGSDNEFKDILAIVPTIALNLWLLFRQGDLGKAVKNIFSKANKALDDPHSDAERGHAHHHLLHHGSTSHPPDSVF